MKHPPPHRKGRKAPVVALRGESGAFDLPSIITGVTVVGVLAAGVLASVFAVIPLSQDNSAKQDLSSIRTAEGTAKVKRGGFLDQAALSTSGLSGPLGSNITVVSGDGSDWCASSRSATGNVYSMTESLNEPVQADLCAAWPIADPTLRSVVLTTLGKPATASIVPASFVNPSGSPTTPSIVTASFSTGDAAIERTSSTATMVPVTTTPTTNPYPLTMRDATALTNLDASGHPVASLSGLQYATNLQGACFNNTNVTDLTPLAGLQGLKSICIDHTPVTNVAPLASLPNLSTISAVGTSITDWAPVASRGIVAGRPTAPQSGPVFPMALSLCQFNLIAGSDGPLLDAKFNSMAGCPAPHTGLVMSDAPVWLNENASDACKSTVDVTVNGGNVGWRTALGQNLPPECASTLSSWAKTLDSGGVVNVTVPVYDGQTPSTKHILGFATVQISGWHFPGGTGLPYVYHNIGYTPSTLNLLGANWGFITKFVHFVSADGTFIPGGPADLGTSVVVPATP